MAVGHLGESQPAALPDRLDAERAVSVASGQDHAGGVLALVTRQGAEEPVDRLAVARPGRRLAHLQATARNIEKRARRQHMDLVDGDLSAVFGHMDRHVGQARDDLGQQAAPLRIEVGDDHEAATGLRGQIAKQTLQSFDAASRSADTNDGETRRSLDHASWSLSSTANSRPPGGKTAPQTSALINLATPAGRVWF